MEKIVITDGYTLNPGDLDWKPFELFGEIAYYDRTPAEKIVDRCREASIIITNKTPLDATTIQASKKLKLIAVTATGYNVVDVQAASEKGVLVCNVPVYGTDSVAQHTFALLLELTNRVGLHSDAVAKGEWYTSPDWTFVKKPLIEVSGKVLGVVGFGRIGSKVAEIARAFGMEVIYYNKKKNPGDKQSVSLETLFRRSDFISLHCPLRPDNKEMVNASLLALMKPSAFIINTSRGQLINERDLATALRENKIAGAALDVLSEEPPKAGHPLIGLSNCLITPHNAWVSFEARSRIMETTLENVRKWIEGNPENVVR